MDRPVRAWEFALELGLGAEHPSIPLFARIARAIALDIHRGRLGPGARLPGSRALARTLGVHRNTVLAAYRELLAEGYLEARSGQSTFVAPSLPELAPRPLASIPRPSRPGAAIAQLSPQPGMPFRLPASATPAPNFEPIPNGTLALYGGLPDLRILPSAAFSRAYRRVLRRPGALAYGDPRGHPRLREALAAMLNARGLAAGPGDLVVTRGSQMGMALCAKALFAPGDVVAVEAYGYRPGWQAMRASGARLVPLPIDGDGLRVDALAALCEREPVRGVYLTPHHQYPTTVALSAPRRLALLELAARRRFVIVEDDYDHEFQYEGRPTLPLASADRARAVIYVGTLSKVFAPGVRIGYVVAPPAVRDRLVAERFYLDRQGDQVTECAVAELFEDGELQRHIRRARRIYHARRDLLVELLTTTFGDLLSFEVPPCGMALWARSGSGLDPDRWLERARAERVLFQPGRAFHFHGRSVPYLRLGFAGLTEDELRLAVRRLDRARRALA
jgi:GntR family transcriptional regulator / MocR family aminotransferase